MKCTLNATKTEPQRGRAHIFDCLAKTLDASKRIWAALGEADKKP
jgi:hypothetical protein